MSADELKRLDNEHILLQDDFFLHPGKNNAVNVSLYEDRIVYEKRKPNSETTGTARSVVRKDTVRLIDVIGCVCGKGRGRSSTTSRLSLRNFTTKKPRNDTAAFFCLHSYPYNRPPASGGWRKKKNVIFRVNKYDNYEQNSEIAQKWRLAVSIILRGGPLKSEQDILAVNLPSPRRLLVLVNPASGRRKGKQIYQKHVMQLLQEAELEYKLVVTEKQFQALEMASVLDPNEWQGIIVVAGDGLVYEVLNGMMRHSNPASVLKVPIGIIPAGSGNALFASVISRLGEQPHKCSILNAAFILCKGGIQPIDLVSVATTKRCVYSFLAINWGIIADIDIESERFRWMGKPRFTLGSVIRIMNLRRYHGIISYVPVDDPEKYEHLKVPSKPPKKNAHVRLPRPHSTMDTTSSMFDESRVDVPIFRSLHSGLSQCGDSSGLAFSEEFIQEKSPGGAAAAATVDSHDGELPGPGIDAAPAAAAAAGPAARGRPQAESLLPPSVLDPLPPGWTTIKGDFIGIIITYLSHIAEDVVVWPNRKYDEGVISIQYIHFPESRRNIAEFVDALSTGRHLQLPITKCIFVKAYRLYPLTTPGIITVDGEVIEYGPIQGEVIPNKAHIILPTHIAQT